MRRQTINASEYAAVLSELAVTATHANVMSVTIGTHEIYGRVVLLRSGTGFVMLADRLEALRESITEISVLPAVAH